MQKVLILLFSFGYLLSNGQEACYLSDGLEADLFCVKMDDSLRVQEAFTFKDTIGVLSKKRHNRLQKRVPIYLSSRINYDTTRKEILQYQGTFEAHFYWKDSIKVNERWYRIHFSYHDDGFVGGRPNQINKRIIVDEIGVIHSHSNFLDAHTLLMIFHKDSSTQEILGHVYEYLEKNKEPYFRNINWLKIASLARKYTFENGIAKLSNRWTDAQKDLKLISTQSKTIGSEIHYTATIQNISDKRYCFAQYGETAPSKAIVHYEHKTHPWDLLDTHYGRHFKRLNEAKYLEPGTTMHFKQKVPIRVGCGSCTHLTYDGFQVYQYRYNLFRWLLNDKLTVDGNDYFIYPLREIRE
jgi:hypothetical protein